MPDRVEPRLSIIPVQPASMEDVHADPAVAFGVQYAPDFKHETQDGKPPKAHKEENTKSKKIHKKKRGV